MKNKNNVIAVECVSVFVYRGERKKSISENWSFKVFLGKIFLGRRGGMEIIIFYINKLYTKNSVKDINLGISTQEEGGGNSISWLMHKKLLYYKFKINDDIVYLIKEKNLNITNLFLFFC